MRWLWFWGGVLLILWVASPALADPVARSKAAGAAHKYVGVKKCKSCHGKELMGDQHAAWEKAEHAKAFETLKGEKAAEIATKKGITAKPYEAEQCLKCHVTAYGVDKTAFAKKPLNAKDGVQCESCHGPGNDYKKKKTMSNAKKAIAKGLWEPGKDEKICLDCHNDESPTWDAAKGFDFEASKKEIAHPIPEDVKGKYLEIVAQRKAEGGASEDDEDED